MKRACSVASSFSAAARCARIGFFRRELVQRLEIVASRVQFTKRIEERAQSRDFLDIALRPFAVSPEIGRGHALFQRA